MMQTVEAGQQALLEALVGCNRIVADKFCGRVHQHWVHMAGEGRMLTMHEML